MHLFSVIKFNLSTVVAVVIAAAVVGYLIGYFLRKMFMEYQIKEAEQLRQKIIKGAEKEAENRIKTADIEARENQIAAKAKTEQELQHKLDKFREQEKGLRKKEDELRMSSERSRDLENEFKGKLNGLSGKEETAQKKSEKY